MSGAAETLPTRAALRELKDELRAVRDGREDLDHKRKLLAAELLRLLARYDERMRARRALEVHARAALAEALSAHGLDELRALPLLPARQEPSLEVRARSYLGVPLLEAELHASPTELRRGVGVTPEARRCARAFAHLLALDAELAALACSLRRLQNEYRRTERRARTLEDILEPELAVAVRHIEEELDDQDQEEGARARYCATQRSSSAER